MGFKEIGKKIQTAREEKGMTQATLAEGLGISQAALSNYELGKRRLYLGKIQAVAELLGKSVDYFIAQEKFFEGDERDASNGRERLLGSLYERTVRLSDGNLRELEGFLDFLEWRRKNNE
ncbi:MAG TPA: helix-turn-helix transcriptional regulator [Spirochaetota bacterium]|nr:helix-turn-helix transcriptional regulator [Spirochaetota bacterium]